MHIRVYMRSHSIAPPRAAPPAMRRYTLHSSAAHSTDIGYSRWPPPSHWIFAVAAAIALAR
jgi:hypothetical protein